MLFTVSEASWEGPHEFAGTQNATACIRWQAISCAANTPGWSVCCPEPTPKLHLQVGEFLLVALAYGLPAWQHLVLAAGCLNAAMLLLYPIVSESARWLLSQGRTQEATSILQRIAQGNSSTLPAQALVSSNSRKHCRPQPTLEAIAEEGLCSTNVVAASCDASAASDVTAQEPLGLCQMLKQRRLATRFFVLLLNWFALMMNYYGIGLGAGGIPGSM